jgi:hypothetical protein
MRTRRRSVDRGRVDHLVGRAGDTDRGAAAGEDVEVMEAVGVLTQKKNRVTRSHEEFPFMEISLWFEQPLGMSGNRNIAR